MFKFTYVYFNPVFRGVIVSLKYCFAPNKVFVPCGATGQLKVKGSHGNLFCWGVQQLDQKNFMMCCPNHHISCSFRLPKYHSIGNHFLSALWCRVSVSLLSWTSGNACIQIVALLCRLLVTIRAWLVLGASGSLSAVKTTSMSTSLTRHKSPLFWRKQDNSMIGLPLEKLLSFSDQEDFCYKSPFVCSSL